MTYQEAYDLLTRAGRHTYPNTMETLILIDTCQHIIRLESRLAGKEVH